MTNTDKALWSAVLLAGTACHQAFAADFEVYGSLRVAVEAVDPDNSSGNFDDYVGIRDAYSRVGAKLSHSFNEDWTILGHLELPLDLGNLDVHSPYDDQDHVRIAKIQLSGPIGTAWFGRGWMAYYNYIAYPVDYFSSYYSGWATFTTFRREDTFYYATPRWKGFQAAFATTADNPGDSDNRDQYVLSYTNGGLSLAIGRDDPDNGTWAINGISASYTSGPWYIAAKYEELDYEVPSSYDGDAAQNLLVQYAVDSKNTVRGMIADVGWDYGDTILHLGWDHQYNKDLKVFLEYYEEETTAAISDRNKSSGLGSPQFNRPATSGGQVLTAGVRYDFSF